MTRPVLLAALPVALVALVAGTVSYSHIVALGLRTGQSLADAHLLPIAVDGLIGSGSVILAAGSALGWLGVVPGVLATLFANLESGLPHGQLAAVVATWPAIAFTVASFMLGRWLRSQVGKRYSSEYREPSTGAATSDDASSQYSEEYPDPSPESVPAALNGHGTGTGWAQPARTGGWS